MPGRVTVPADTQTAREQFASRPAGVTVCSRAVWHVLRPILPARPRTGSWEADTARNSPRAARTDASPHALRHAQTARPSSGGATQLRSVLLLSAAAAAAAFGRPTALKDASETFNVQLKQALLGNATARGVSSSIAGISSSGYLCFSSSSAAYSNTLCGYSTILYDPSSSCAGSGFGYYCSSYTWQNTGSASSTDGRCYDSPYHAYQSTSCTSTSQILQDYSRTGACSGTSYDAYTWCGAGRGVCMRR